MKYLKWSTILILALPLLLAACGSASASATTPTITAPPVAGEFVGVTNSGDAIGLSTNGQQLIAYACDGTPTHAITFSVWFKGAVSHNAVSLFAKNGEHLVATLTPQSATGTVTLTGGKSFSFTASAVTNRAAGLYRDEETFAGVRYLAGWILPDLAVATRTPASSASAEVSLLSLFLNPTMPEKCDTNYCAVEATHGGILNEQTGALLSPPTTLINHDLAARRMPVPNLGTFTMKQCQQGQC